MMHVMRRSGALIAPLLATALVACGDERVPAAPKVDVPEGPVNQNPYPLTGTGQVGAVIEVRGGATPVVTAEVDQGGRFTISVPLVAEEENELFVSQRSSAGVESPFTRVTLLHDGTPPPTPELLTVRSPTRSPIVTIRGVTEPEAMVEITGGESDASGTAHAADGMFAIEVPLRTSLSQPVENELTVVAKDLAGNVSGSATVTIVFDANLPVETPDVDPPQSPTNEGSILLTGRAEPHSGIGVTGGANPANGNADAQGRFTVEVELRPNALNTLYVFAIGSGSFSASVVVEVLHDGIPPEAPALQPVPEATADTTLTLTGTAEPKGSVAATIGSVTTTAEVDETGDFTLEVALVLDEVNEIEVVAMDRAGNRSDSVLVVVRQDANAPTPPRLDPFVSPTSDATITLTGSTDADVEVEVTGGASTASTTANDQGRFSVAVALTPNSVNELQVSRTDSGAKVVAMVTHDDIAPATPSLAPVPSPTNRRTIVIAGTTEAAARVQVTGGEAAATSTADLDGRFSVSVGIAADTTSTLLVTARDRAGNVSEPVSVTVVHSSETGDAPILDEPNPAPTSEPTYLLTGRIATPAAGSVVQVQGGVEPVQVDTDPTTGAFAAEVELAANETSELEVVSVLGEIESPPALVTVVHDDIAPEAPNGGTISLGSGAGTCGVILGGRRSISVSGSEGTVEPRARVRVTNTNSNTTVTPSADDTGAFSTNLSVCRGDTLRFVAVDAAGNESGATDVAVP